MAIGDAVSQVQQFKRGSLTETIADIEAQLTDERAAQVDAASQSFGIDGGLLMAAAEVKQASAQIDVVIHAVGILYALPHILGEDEVIEGLSLGAGSAGSDFDVVTNQRIAEFKFIQWQGGSNALRKVTLFQDFFKLVRETTQKEKVLYLLDTEIPLRFLQGSSQIRWLLARNRQLRDDFEARYGQTYRAVGEYYKAHQDEVHIMNLAEMVRGFDEFIAIFR